MLQTRSDGIRVWVINTAAAGGASVVVTNTPLPVIINNSGGLFAMQSGAWTVSSTILNSAGWIVSVANTQTAINIINSAGWIFAQSNTNNQGVIVQNSGGLFANQSGTWTVGISNSAGWVFAQSNTNNQGVIIQNSGGLFAQQSGTWTVGISNSAGWVLAQSNTAGLTAYALDSSATGSVVSVIASTVGVVTLAASQTKRVALAIYNASANPLFMRLGAGASTASYTLMMVGSGYYELPRPIYNGIITGIWQTAQGNAYITETT